jgi:hypothetical protein
MRLANRRRTGQPENLDAEVFHIAELKKKQKGMRGIARGVRKWQDSYYAASRYYGFGCRELCAGRLESARRCFIQSLKTNAMFLKSWVGALLSLLPFVARNTRFAFRSSMKQLEYQRWSRPVMEADPSLSRHR